MFRNLPPVTKNLILLNIVVYVVCLIFYSRGIDLTQFLGAHYYGSPLFQPYQVVSYFFTHSIGDPLHILMNMYILFIFGPILERVWGPKKFFIAYVTSAIGAYFIYTIPGSIEIMHLKETLLANGIDVQQIDAMIRANQDSISRRIDMAQYIDPYFIKSVTPMVGASGAIFGIMAAFAYLFPNTELYLLFIPVPIKAKYLIGGYFLLEVYLSYRGMSGGIGDTVAHLAHVGGAIFGLILVYFWNKKDRTNFY